MSDAVIHTPSNQISALTIAVPVAVATLLLIVLMPLPIWLIDLLLCANLAASLLMVLVVLSADRPAELTLFPSMLLGLTLFRIALNIATTRLILTAGHAGSSDPADIAGHTIEAFGRLMAGGDLVAGIAIFAILTVVQFVVITRGAGRIGEVAARFALDALPGRQMAIDAELRAGSLSAAAASQKRETLSEEADFFAGLDGVGKFMRGDAVVSLLIVAVNVVGGLYIGLARFGWDLELTARTFTLLTIGDGLASQVPALLCSVAAGILVTRGSRKVVLVAAIRAQFLRRPAALLMAAGLIALLALTPLPTLPLVVLAIVFSLLAVHFDRARKRVRPVPPLSVRPGVLSVPPLELRFGPDLRGMAATLIAGIEPIRQRLARELGVPLPAVVVRDDPQVPPTGYEISLRGEVVADGSVFPGCRLVPAPANQYAGVYMEPFEQVPARWDARTPASPHEHTDSGSFRTSVVGLHPAEVMLRHLDRVARDHADELLTREVLIDLLQTHKRQLSGEVLITVHRVFCQLLRERVPVRDVGLLIDAATSGDATQDWRTALNSARAAVRRSIVRPLLDDDGVLRVLSVADEALAVPAGELATEVRRHWPGYPASRPTLLVAAPLRLSAWSQLTAAGLDVTCLCQADIPLKQRVQTVGSINICRPAPSKPSYAQFRMTATQPLGE